MLKININQKNLCFQLARFSFRKTENFLLFLCTKTHFDQSLSFIYCICLSVNFLINETSFV